MAVQSASILKFYRELKPEFDMPEGVNIMNPFDDKVSWQITRLFYEKFYSDTERRHLIFGINPGRFGGGITGIPFTDPIRLADICGIENTFQKKSELSSQYVYEVIKAYGGPGPFYKKFFITALSPLGFTRAGLNMNYYDDKALLKSIEPFMVDCIRKQLKTLSGYTTCFCLGEGTNFKIFSKLNEKYGFFESIIPLPHPRWIMQYRRKKMGDYVDVYVKAFNNLEIS